MALANFQQRVTVPKAVRAVFITYLYNESFIIPLVKVSYPKVMLKIGIVLKVNGRCPNWNQLAPLCLEVFQKYQIFMLKVWIDSL